MVGAELNVDLDVAHHFAHFAKRPIDGPPLLNADGHVVFPHQLRGGPSEVPGFRVNGEFVFPWAHLVRKDVGRNGLAVEPSAWDQAVGQHVAVGVVGGRVVDPRLVQTRVLGGRIQQLHAVVVARLRVDDEQGSDGERRVHRAHHVEHAFVAVGVFHGKLVHPRTTVGVRAPVRVHLDVSAELTHRQLTGQAVQVVTRFVAPPQEQKRPVCQGVGLRVGRDDDLVGQPLDVGVGDLARAVVGRPSCGGVNGHGPRHRHPGAPPRELGDLRVGILA